jgi:hypothetical protein
MALQSPRAKKPYSARSPRQTPFTKTKAAILDCFAASDGFSTRQVNSNEALARHLSSPCDPQSAQYSGGDRLALLRLKKNLASTTSDAVDGFSVGHARTSDHDDWSRHRQIGFFKSMASTDKAR